MNIFTLVGLIAAIAVVVMLVASFIKKPENWLTAYLRYFLATFFIFSGVVKAIDPTGTAIKMEEYFTIFTEYIPFLTPIWDLLAGLALPVSIFMIVLEIALGITLILGVLVGPTLWLYAGLILFFTALTGFSHLTGQVTDCGCFGDFVKLKPFESFWKDVFLTVLVALLFFTRKHITALFKKKIGLGIFGALTLLSLIFTFRNYYNLPIVDFRAYKIGTNLIEGRSTEGLDEGEIQIMYTLKKEGSGEEKTVSSDDYIAQKIWEDKTWVMDKEKTDKIVIREPELPKIKDFLIFNADDEEIADSILAQTGFHFFVPAYNIERSKTKGFKPINDFLKQAKADGITAIGLTSSDLTEANQHTDGLYDFHTLDATPIKTMIRSNPGLVLIKDGVLVGKWHHGHIPSYASIKKEFGISKQQVAVK